MKLAIVTATLNTPQTAECIRSWLHEAEGDPDLYCVAQGEGEEDWHVASRYLASKLYRYGSRVILGTVPAFAIGVQKALDDGAEIIACLHDDLLIEESGWDTTVQRLFKACPRAGLCGFGGAKGLGSALLYTEPYDPMQLARIGFRSNMRDAEAHGQRSTVAEPVACLDGFSQIGTRAFWLHQRLNIDTDWPPAPGQAKNLFERMRYLGVTHHFYDGMLGCYAKRLGYQVWYLPVACHHYGGRTAVDPRYNDWANRQPMVVDPSKPFPTGDQYFWERAHRIGYTEFTDVLPIRT